MICPNCRRRTKGKIYCDDPVCKLDRASKRGIAVYKKYINKKPLLLK